MPALSPRRIIGFIIGTAFLFWLPVEDTTICFTVLLSISTCILVGNYWIERILIKGDIAYMLKLALLGVVLGLITIGTTIFLMALKSGLHAHGFAEFTPGQMTNVLRMTSLSVPLGVLISVIMGMNRIRNRSN